MESSFDVKKISRLQENLSSIRKVASWSADSLAEMLGVTRQTVVNLENSNVKMSKTQYIAIRALLDAEVRRSDNQTLGKVIEILVDDETVSTDEKDEIKKTISNTADSVGRRMGSVAIGTAVGAALFPLLGPLPMAAWFIYEVFKGNDGAQDKKGNDGSQDEQGNGSVQDKKGSDETQDDIH